MIAHSIALPAAATGKKVRKAWDARERNGGLKRRRRLRAHRADLDAPDRDLDGLVVAAALGRPRETRFGQSGLAFTRYALL
jgi:hypothetical protein